MTATEVEARCKEVGEAANERALKRTVVLIEKLLTEIRKKENTNDN